MWFIFVVGWHYRDCYKPGTDINFVNDYREGLPAAEKYKNRKQSFLNCHEIAVPVNKKEIF
jgi:hypothetical protein